MRPLGNSIDGDSDGNEYSVPIDQIETIPIERKQSHTWLNTNTNDFECVSCRAAGAACVCVWNVSARYFLPFNFSNQKIRLLCSILNSQSEKFTERVSVSPLHFDALKSIFTSYICERFDRRQPN